MKIVRAEQVPETGVSHNPEIRKRVLVSNGEVPKLTNFSQSVFAPGQVCHAHTHPDMYEIYLVSAGEGSITVDGEVVRLGVGDCLVVEPGEEHAMSNPSEQLDLHLTYFGIEL